MDSAMGIWMLSQDEVTKNIRGDIKGGWNFAEFYGSYYKQCASVLWKQIKNKTKSGLTLQDHLRERGIYGYTDFVEHCRVYEDIFWNDRFAVYAKWKESINKLYRKQGFIENKFGFRFTGYMNSKQATNFPIQSAAFHILLHSLILINDIAKEEKWKSGIIGQIHDSILLDLHPKEEKHVLKTCVHIMSEKMRELHPWIDVPIPADVELTDIDQAWWYKKESIL
jgi:hypothetical protein